MLVWREGKESEAKGGRRGADRSKVRVGWQSTRFPGVLGKGLSEGLKWAGVRVATKLSYVCVCWGCHPCVVWGERRR